MKAENKPCERHCWHLFGGVSNLHFCCRENCFDILSTEGNETMEEKTHGGAIFTRMPVVRRLRPSTRTP